MDEKKYPRKVNNEGASKLRGKRKATVIVNLNSDEDIKVEGHNEIPSPIWASPTHEEEGNAGQDMDCMEALGPWVVQLDIDVQVKGDYTTLQRERAERATSSLRFYAEPTEFQRLDVELVNVSPPES